MSPLTISNPYLRKTRSLQRTLREDARESSIFEGATIPAAVVHHEPASMRRRMAFAKKSASGR